MIYPQAKKFTAAQALHQSLPKLERMMRQIEQKAGATGQQLSAIAAISEFGKDRLHVLSAHEHVSRPTMSRIVTTLIERGWVEKSDLDGDKRSAKLKVTKDGRNILVRCCEERTRLLMTLMDELGDEECINFEKTLRKLKSGVNATEKM